MGCSQNLSRWALGVVLIPASWLAAAVADRTYTGDRTVIEINGERPPVLSISGGEAVGIVSEQSFGGDVGMDKRISGVEYEDIVFTLSPTNIPKAVTDALGGKASSISGAIEYADFNYKSIRRLAFEDATVTAVRFPALDGASKDPAKVEITLSPRLTKELPGDGADIRGKVSPKQKAVLTSNFRVELPGVQTNRVATVSPIELRMKSAASDTGNKREASRQALEIPNITIGVSAVDAESWRKWHQDSVVAGKQDEKTMRVVFLAPNMKDPLLTLELSGVGIIAVRRDAAEANSGKIARIHGELYAEQLKLTNNQGTAASGSPASAEPAPAPASAAENQPAPAASTAQKPLTRAQRERLRARAAEEPANAEKSAPAPRR